MHQIESGSLIVNELNAWMPIVTKELGCEPKDVVSHWINNIHALRKQTRLIKNVPLFNEE